jgi:hypothetical protein
MTNSFKQFLFESEGTQVQYAIEGKDDAFMGELVNNLSFVYKKRKEKYLRPIKIVGVVGENIELRLQMSNKDIILFTYKDSELKITINGDMVYHMDEIEKKDIINKIEKYYKTHIEKQDFVVLTKNNPFGK